MAIQPHTRLGPYEIISAIGAGGMGEVYEARDSRLNRNVALKVLPEIFARDNTRMARFEREAKVLASLNHPNIASIYGLEESGTIRALVMELVEGPTLADRIHGRAISIGEALSIARQIAEAVEYAHEHNVIHRDLKPANIKIRADGTVKVLDFGLAKALVDEPQEADVGNLPTLSVAPTVPGTILGTAAYMSPEQARGLAVDKRSDVWAFGAIGYELLTGRQAFPGATFSDTIAAVLEREPDWTALPQSTPPHVERLLRRCLEKDLKRRLRDIGDARIELEDALRAPQSASPPLPIAKSHRTSIIFGAGAVVLFGLLALVIVLYRRRPQENTSVTRLSLFAPGQVSPQIAPAVSPDGKRIAFVSADTSGRPMLWIRELDSQTPRVLADTEDAAHPFWSPDGRSLGFLAGGKLKRVDTTTGAVLVLSETAVRSGGTWSPNGTILFLPRPGQIASVPAAGGPIVPLLDGAASLHWPRFLPDGQHFLFVDEDEQHSSGIYVGMLGSKETKRLMASDFEAAYSPPGFLLFVRGETLMAQPFDAYRLVLTGEPALVAEGIWGASFAHRASFSVSQTGVLAYSNASLEDTQLVWFDRTGQTLGTARPPMRIAGVDPQLSPDGKHVAVSRGSIGEEDIWLLDLANNMDTRLTLTAGTEELPVWSSDGRRLLFQGSSRPGRKLMLKEVDPVGPDMVIADLPAAGMLCDWSRDGQFVLYSGRVTGKLNDLWILPLSGDRKPRLFIHSDVANSVQAQISPNGRWVAYTSYESGKDEVYVASFPTPTVKRQISSDGGMQPRWRSDGSELFYLARDQSLTAVPILNQDELRTGPAKPLFRTRLLPNGSQATGLYTVYDVARDGQRFLMNVDPENPAPPYTVVLNWPAGLQK